MPEANTLLLDENGGEILKLWVCPMPNGHPPKVIVLPTKNRAFAYKLQHPERFDLAVYYETSLRMIPGEGVPDGQ